MSTSHDRPIADPSFTFHQAWGAAKDRVDYHKPDWNRAQSHHESESWTMSTWMEIVRAAPGRVDIRDTDRPEPNPQTKAFDDLGLNTPEPAPTANDSTPVWDLVIEDVVFSLPAHESTDRLIADMRARDHSGRAKYGTPLQAHNGRNPMVDAYQEALDLCVYLRQAYGEGRRGVTIAMYDRAIGFAAELSLMVTRGDS